MAKKKQETVETITEQPKVDESVEKLKMKKPKKFEQISDTIKVDLSKPLKPEENETKKDNADNSGVVAESKSTEPTQEQEKIQSETEAQAPTLQEVTDELVETEKEEIVQDTPLLAESNIELPKNVEKLMAFMKDTGGDINDYVKLNKDYSDMDNQSLLKEYYKTTKPHLQEDEIDFLMEDQFSYDEESDEEREVKRKKLALKEQVADAKSHLDGLKSKYYEDIKAGSRLTPDAKKAMDFFNRYNKESEQNKKIQSQAKDRFLNKTNEVFDQKFKGFEYNVGDKKYRFNVKDPSKIKENQSDINNFVKKFLNEKSQMEDARGYHKSLFTAMNSDAVAKHFYEQGKADALKDSMSKSKNIDMSPRESHGATTNDGGLKFKVLNDDSTSGFKFKIKNKNK
tara:strand:- start:33 stop:1226 length:1194 start_codon:yes stop_codon:yes gene_type:complete